ncbi:hypothetical protein, partial [Pseudonocardia sp. NPDC046786]|uniref:hypothetical protein n=1 Tax=Pseudonocardia sp. NPDC046786 TaxID=3155471 RepID=UPI0033E77C75
MLRLIDFVRRGADARAFVGVCGEIAVDKHAAGDCPNLRLWHRFGGRAGSAEQDRLPEQREPRSAIHLPL